MCTPVLLGQVLSFECEQDSPELRRMIVEVRGPQGSPEILSETEREVEVL